MKTLSLKTLPVLVGVVLMAGFAACEKAGSDDATPMPQDEVKVHKSDAPKSWDTVTFSMDKFEDNFGWYIGFMDAGDKYRIAYDVHTKLCTLEEIGKDPDPVGAVVCSGNGIGFVKCVKEWLEDNPGDCLCVSFDGSGFEADDDCTCPD